MRLRLPLMLAILAVSAPVAAQIPQTFKNLQHFQKDISRDQLVQRMRDFSISLGVRCQHCHSGGDGVSFEGVDWASDSKPAKVTARAMLRMIDQINGPLLESLTTRAAPRVTVECATCHRGVTLPKSLKTTLLETVASDGAAAAAARYRQLRRDVIELGQYNFSGIELMEVSRRLRETERLDAAIVILELNGEFHPDLAAVDFELGEISLSKGDRAGALTRYRAALKKAPDLVPARRRIEELEKTPR